MKSRSTSRLAHPLAAAIVALLAATQAHAQLTWDANGTGAAQTDGAGVWLTANQWWNGTANANWSSGSAAVFGNGGAGGAVTLASSTTVASLTFNNFSGTYTLGTAAVGSTITLNGGITKNTGAGAATIISPITLGAAQSWNNNSLGLLTIGTGAVTNGGFLLTLGGTGNTTVSSVIGGAGGLTKSDAGLATLSGANTYGGATTINGGILVASTLANGGATSGIGNSSNAATNLVFGAPAATLRYTGSTVTTDRGFTLSSGAGGGATIEASGVGAANNLGTLTLNNTVPIAYGAVNETRTLTLGGTNASENNFGKVLANNGTAATSLVKSGAGTWVLSASNTYTGGSNINAGSLVFRTLLSKSGTGTHAFAAGTTLGLGVANSGFFTSADLDSAFSATTGHAAFTGNLSGVTVTSTTNVGIDTTSATAGNFTYATNIGAVTKGLTKFGTNTLTLSGSSAYTGATTIVGGTLAVATLANAGSNSSIGNFATAGATGLILSGGTFNYTGASTTTDRGFSTIGNAVNTISVGTGVNLALGASVKNENNSGLTFSATGAGSSITISSLTVAAGTNADFNISANTPTVTIQNLNVTGSNVIVQRTGSAVINIGNINGSGSSGWLGNMNVTGVISGYTGELVLGSGVVNLTGLNTFDPSVVSVQQAGIYTINTIKNVGAGDSSLGNPSTAARGIINFGNGGGAPTLRYIGTGGADGTTNRVLNLRGSGTLNLEQAGTGLLKFTGNTTADTGNTGAKILNLTGSTAGTGEFSGNIVEHTLVNKTSVSKSGTGTWTLSGANSYTGATSVEGGTLVAGANAPSLSNGAFGNASSEVNLGLAGGNNNAGILNGGAFNIGRNIRLLTNDTTDAGTRVLTLGGNTAHNSTFSGNIILGTASQAGRGVTLTAASGGQVTFSGVIQDPATMDTTSYTVTKAGAGTVVFNNSNTYTGATSVTQGTLLVNGSTATASTVSVSSGATLGGTGAVGGAVNVTGSLSPGASIETLSTGTLSFANSSTLIHELNSSVATSVGSDLLKVSGNLNLVGTVGLSLDDIAVTDAAFTVGDVFSLINYTGTWNSGLFTLGLNELADEEEFTFGLNTWRISYNDATGGLNYLGEYAGGSDSFVNLTVVPEPRAALLGGLGMLLLLRRRRRNA